MIVEAFGATDVGCVREGNEDTFVVADLDAGGSWGGESPLRTEGGRGPILVVCDGMGGSAGGEVASSLAAQAVADEMRAAQSTTDRDVYARLLRRALRVANRRVFEQAQLDPLLRGMGTTVSAAGLVDGNLVIAQIGDSRVYVERLGNLIQVTRDQSIVSVLYHAGRLTAEEARSSPQSNMILQALGVARDVDVSLSFVELRRGDRVLLCSDGLHGPVGDQAMGLILEHRLECANAATALIAAARAGGGPDNITAIVARVSGEDLSEPEGPDDLPKFIELDPGEEGARALTSTSKVARRLAAKAGFPDAPRQPVVPATGSYPAVRGKARRRALAPTHLDVQGPAERELAARRRGTLLAWGLVALVALAVSASIVGGLW